VWCNNLDPKLILDAQLFGRHGIDPVVAFLHGLRENHHLSEAVFLVDQFDYRIPVARLGLKSRVDYIGRTLVEKGSHTLNMRVERVHHSQVGSRRNARKWIDQVMHYYNRQRPHQSLGGRTSAEEGLH